MWYDGAISGVSEVCISEMVRFSVKQGSVVECRALLIVSGRVSLGVLQGHEDSDDDDEEEEADMDNCDDTWATDSIPEDTVRETHGKSRGKFK
eukprot:126319-Pyramimonas_sp.AAC.2